MHRYTSIVSALTMIVIFSIYLFSYLRDLLSEFHSTLSDVKRNEPLVLLVDGADVVRDGGGQLRSDWMPEQLPRVGQTDGFCFISTVAPAKTAVPMLHYCPRVVTSRLKKIINTFDHISSFHVKIFYTYFQKTEIISEESFVI